MTSIYIIINNDTPIRAFFDRNLAEAFLKDIESCQPQVWLHLEECPVGFDLTLAEATANLSKLRKCSEEKERLNTVINWLSKNEKLQPANSCEVVTGIKPLCELAKQQLRELPSGISTKELYKESKTDNTLNKSIYERICKSMERILETPWDTLEPNNDFVEDLGIDSVDRVEIVMAVEDEFNFELLDSDIADVKTIQDLVKVVENKLGK